MKKTFFNLIQDVWKKGECHQCGGCVAFCSAINYGALAMDDHGKPFYKDIDKCNECGLCYSICPQTRELDGEIKQNAQWEHPLGHVISFNVTRAADPAIRQRGTDGGVVTAILSHLLNAGRIDGAIVSRPTPQGRVPFLAKTESDIIASAGSHFGNSQGKKRYCTTKPGSQGKRNLSGPIIRPKKNGKPSIFFKGPDSLEWVDIKIGHTPRDEFRREGCHEDRYCWSREQMFIPDGRYRQIQVSSGGPCSGGRRRH